MPCWWTPLRCALSNSMQHTSAVLQSWLEQRSRRGSLSIHPNSKNLASTSC
jgi:hypothetical protein